MSNIPPIQPGTPVVLRYGTVRQSFPHAVAQESFEIEIGEDDFLVLQQINGQAEFNLLRCFRGEQVPMLLGVTRETGLVRLFSLSAAPMPKVA